jgi:hypothetical protein
VIFYLAAAVYLLGAIAYGCLASGYRQKWAEVETGYLAHVNTAETDRGD